MYINSARDELLDATYPTVSGFTQILTSTCPLPKPCRSGGPYRRGIPGIHDLPAFARGAGLSAG